MHTDVMIQLIANLLPEDMETYSERAAIAEYDGKLSREEAESAAVTWVMAKRIRGEK